MEKPRTFAGYHDEQSDACERTLITLLRGLGPWKRGVVLVGGLSPRYLIRQDGRNHVPRHIGTSDVDLVLDFELLSNIDAYRTIERNLQRLGFDRGINEEGNPQHFKWTRRLESGAEIAVDLLCSMQDERGGKVTAVPNERRLSAISIPGAWLALEDHIEVTVGAELLNEGGYAREVVRVTRIAPFIVLKALAYDDRWEPKDAYDLVYAIQFYGSGSGDAALELASLMQRFPDDPLIRQAIDVLKDRFGSDDQVRGADKDGPVSYARFQNAADSGVPLASTRNEAADAVGRFLHELDRVLNQERS